MNQLLSALLSLVIVGVALGQALPMLLQAQLQPAQNDAGNQLAPMQAAGAAYMANNASALMSLPLGQPQMVTPNQLKAAGYLAASFNDFNVFGQNYLLVVTHIPDPSNPTRTIVDGMVYSYGGDTIPDDVAIRVAEAGPAGATVVLSSDPANFEGAAGGETEPVANFQQAAPYQIAVGHIGAHITPLSYSAQAPFLNRYNTGNPDDNTMHTAIHMDGNDIDMGTTATTGGGNINMAGGNVASATQVSASQQVNTPMVADPTDSSYQVSMAGSSKLKDMTVTGSQTVGTAGNNNTLSVNGNLVVNGDLEHFSDMRLKTNIQPIYNASSVLSQIQVVYFEWRANGRRDIGVLAQKLQPIAPDLVDVAPNGYLTVKYEKLIPLLLAAQNEQRAVVEAVQGANDRQRSAIEALQRAIEAQNEKIKVLSADRRG